MLNISLPDQLQAFLEAQATATGFNTVSEYIHHLILREQERLTQQAHIESLLLAGLDSGEPVEVTDEWWDSHKLNYFLNISKK